MTIATEDSYVKAEQDGTDNLTLLFRITFALPFRTAEGIAPPAPIDAHHVRLLTCIYTTTNNNQSIIILIVYQ